MLATSSTMLFSWRLLWMLLWERGQIQEGALGNKQAEALRPAVGWMHQLSAGA